MHLSQVRAICEAAMREYGMPARIRTDNGAPFAGTGLLGLSKLSLGWMKLGIVHERIQAGRPQQNGRHERRVNNSGDISWHKNRIFISEAFRFEELGVELITPGLYRVFFRDMEIGELNSEELRFRAARRVV
jgi:transposase InsO family protein